MLALDRPRATPRPVPSRATSPSYGSTRPVWPALGQRAAQLVGVPAGACVENDDVHDSGIVSYGVRELVIDPPITNVNRNSPTTSVEQRRAQHVGIRAVPAWNVRPLVALVSHTSAGLKSIGSIL